MASDAFMELETRDLIGETRDAKFGMDDDDSRAQGAFEISSFSISATTQGDDLDMMKALAKMGGDPKKFKHHSKSGKSKQRELTFDTFTIKKAIDSASPTLLRLCCQQAKHTDPADPIEWAFISLREAGELPKSGTQRKPWLVIEFYDLYIDEFSWEMNPNASGDEIKDQETIKFTFGKIRIKYFAQDETGAHSVPMKQVEWNQEKKSTSDIPDEASETW